MGGGARSLYRVGMLIPGAGWLTRFASTLREIGPYAAIVLLVPGGTLIALSLWAVRRSMRGTAP